MVQNLISTVNKILSEHTEYNALRDVEEFTTVAVDSESDAILNLHIGNEGAGTFSIAQYYEGDARKPDTFIMLEREGDEFRPMYMESINFPYTEDEEKISDYAKNFANNLESQFL